jgi:hypothetical protein
LVSARSSDIVAPPMRLAIAGRGKMVTLRSHAQPSDNQ